MDGIETINTIASSKETYNDYSVFDIDFNGTTIPMMMLKDVKVIVKNYVDAGHALYLRSQEEAGNQMNKWEELKEFVNNQYTNTPTNIPACRLSKGFFKTMKDKMRSIERRKKKQVRE